MLYQTKTGNFLQVINGGGESTPRITGHLSIVRESQYDSEQEARLKKRQIYSEVGQIWDHIAVRLLTDKQYQATTANPSYKFKAQQAMKASSSKRVHALCQKMLDLCDQAEQIGA